MPARMPSSFDVVGSKGKSVAIVEIAEGVNGEEVAKEILKQNRNIKSVLEKLGDRGGECRLRSYRLLAGDKDTEVLHKEFGYMLKLDPQKTYFSPRESTERMRIAEQVKDGETVMVMFSGIAPFAIAIAKKRDVEKVVAIEINHEAVEYAKTNIRINKLSHKIVAVEGDVRTACESWYGKCDRVVMPLPKGAGSFLDIAARCLKPAGGFVHFYSWGREPDAFANAETEIAKGLKDFSMKYNIVGRRLVLPYSPHTWKVCMDIKIGKV